MLFPSLQRNGAPQLISELKKDFLATTELLDEGFPVHV